MNSCNPHFVAEDRSPCSQFKMFYSFSEKFPQEMGAPQGSILSPTLFNLKINSIVKCVSSDIECSLYVDDFLITCKSTELHSAEQKLQKCFKKLEVWCNENGFKFSPTKTNCVHFTKQEKYSASTQPLFKWTKNTGSSGIKIFGGNF